MIEAHALEMLWPIHIVTAMGAFTSVASMTSEQTHHLTSSGLLPTLPLRDVHGFHASGTWRQLRVLSAVR